MDDIQYEPKRFLFPILSLVLISIISIASINAYITISMFKTHVQEHIKQRTQEYTKEQKNIVRKDVEFANESIKFEITKIENTLKTSLKEKVLIAIDITQFIYDTYKSTLNKEQIKKKIAKALEKIKFNDKNAYYFMYDNKTKILFGHPIKKFIGRDMTNYKDARGQSLMELDTKALKKDKIGFSEIYFKKPDNENKEFPKITCITKFEALDLVIGTGEYLDEVEEQTKKDVIDRFNSKGNDNKDKYLVILDVHDLKGGDAFATVLLNSNRHELVGNKVSDKDKDVKGNRFRKDFLNLVVQKGEGYSEYWYKKPSTESPSLKMTYFYLQKDWNWIIASGFYFEDLEKQIVKMEESINIQTDSTINQTLTWVLLLSLIAIIVAIFVSFRIDKTIKNYANRIIEYEDNKRKQDNILMQQSKLASMGEMIGNIAHQWRQPLAVISMDANNILLDVNLNMLNTDELIKHAQNINTQTTYLSSTIDDFKNFIKGDREKKTFDLKDNINNFIHLVASSIKNNNIHVILELKNDINTNGYKNELIQCFMNIFNNSKDALIQNNVDNKLIFISTSVKNNKAIIKIKDNAGGIPENILHKIFEPYFTTKHKSQGTGLGLHMTYNLIVDGMAGTIEAYNVNYEHNETSYKGAEFKIMLPIS
ncbi:MAG: signal transduction histidine kinase [Sulfurimonas sp.]|jgi:signal transduction histidine kinase